MRVQHRHEGRPVPLRLVVTTDAHIYYQLLALCVFIIGLWLIRDRSRMGFAMKTLGADETVARQIGINTTRA